VEYGEPMRLVRLLAVGAIVTVLAVPGAAEVRGVVDAQASRRMCNNTYGGDVVVARNLSCRKAHRVVRTWARRFKRDRIAERTVLGFRCHDRSNDVEDLVVRCRRNSRTVTFYANVP
jgi:hypothetical protein